jgi:hypothetical protein
VCSLDQVRRNYDVVTKLWFGGENESLLVEIIADSGAGSHSHEEFGLRCELLEPDVG